MVLLRNIYIYIYNYMCAAAVDDEENSVAILGWAFYFSISLHLWNCTNQNWLIRIVCSNFIMARMCQHQLFNIYKYTLNKAYKVLQSPIQRAEYLLNHISVLYNRDSSVSIEWLTSSSLLTSCCPQWPHRYRFNSFSMEGGLKSPSFFTFASRLITFLNIWYPLC